MRLGRGLMTSSISDQKGISALVVWFWLPAGSILKAILFADPIPLIIPGLFTSAGRSTLTQRKAFTLLEAHANCLQLEHGTVIHCPWGHSSIYIESWGSCSIVPGVPKCQTYTHKNWVYQPIFSELKQLLLWNIHREVVLHLDILPSSQDRQCYGYAMRPERWVQVKDQSRA